MNLFFRKEDLPAAQRLGDRRLDWLGELGALDLSEAAPQAEGFLFGYATDDNAYRRLLAEHPHVFDRAEHREELAELDQILERLENRGIRVPTPKTWSIELDGAIPRELPYPLFVRTAKTSWKRGGQQARVENLEELRGEMELLRRALGCNSRIIVREWIDAAVAGKYRFGDAPQEIRVWIVDRQPVAWSFHYLAFISEPEGFPPAAADLKRLALLSAQVGATFQSRLIAADFIRDVRGEWWFLEAGPGSISGTAHEAVFKYVCERLRGDLALLRGDAVGGLL